MKGRFAFLEADGVDAAAELEAMLADPETYETAFTLYEHLRKTARNAAKHNDRVNVWKPFIVSGQTYPVFVTATDPFMVYLVAQIAETREYKVLAVMFGRFTGEPTEKFHDGVWRKAERRLRLLKW